MASINSLTIKLKNLEKIDINKALTKACLLVEADAKTLCPVDSGRLKGSIHSQVDNNVGQVGTNVSYATFCEFGTGLFSSLGNGRKDVP